MKEALKPCLVPPLRAVWLRLGVVRCVFGLTAMLLARRLLPDGGLPGLPALLICLVFALMAWLNLLRLGGANLMTWKSWKVFRRRDPLKTAMADHLDEDILDVDDLDPKERAACLVLANGLNALVFLALSLAKL